MHVVILGCGRVGSALALELERFGHSVAVIDQDSGAFHRLTPAFTGRTVVGVGFDRDTLVEADIEKADAFASVSSGDNTNIISARVAREIFNVPRVVARIYDPRRAEVYERLGIPTVATVRWTINEIHQLLFHRGLEPEQHFGNGETVLVRSTVPDYLDGRNFTEFNVEGEIQVVEVTRGGRSLIPGPGTMIESGDLVSFVVASTSLGRLRSFLNKEFGQ